MKPFKSVGLLMLFTHALQAETSLLPGVTYYQGREALAGKLTFLLTHGDTLDTNSAAAASVYEFDLTAKKLRKLTDAPKGLFIPSDRGDISCVVFRPGNWYHSDDTNLFIYSDALQQSRTLT